MTKIYNLYLDEAGDEGFSKLHLDKVVGGGQSRWLVVGGIITDASNNRNTAKWRDGILACFPSRNRRDVETGAIFIGKTSGTNKRSRYVRNLPRCLSASASY